MNEWEQLARAASLPVKEDEKRSAQKTIREKAEKAGVNVASVKKLYEARGRGECAGFSVPACNIRGMTYFTARAAYRAAQREKVGLLVFEIARSEMDYTFQNPAEYASQIIAAAAAEKFPGPVCLQG
ncbi:MAG: aldolase, partial [bacterium]|nr:aldolase [bacterium]